MHETLPGLVPCTEVLHCSVQWVVSLVCKVTFGRPALRHSLHLTIYRIWINVRLPTYYSWSLALREERRLKVYENRVLRGIFGSKRDEVTGEWRKLHNEELTDLYCSPNIVRVIKTRRMRWTGYVAPMGERRGVFKVSVGKSEGKRPLRRPRRRWEDNINMDLQEVWCGGMDWSWLRIGTGGGHLWMRWTFVFHTMWGISWLAENRLGSQEWPCSME